ncbi:MAG: alanyl-tRNA editing protein [Gammaproteobacteria bacterium]
MTIKVFWDNPYLTELTTTVKTVDGNRITLSETIFYAFSGGQESDAGTIGAYEVFKAEKVCSEIYYWLPDNHALKVNDIVTIIINWSRRYSLMRLHFAAEIVLELIYQKYPEIQKVGAHIGEHKARIDFRWDKNTAPFLSDLQNAAQAIIDENQSIATAFSNETEERRYWKIEGFSEVPCGGTHIRNTAEVGVIRLKRVNPGKGLERIEIFVTDKHDLIKS